jgi:TonB-dependent starch-binding outer membrane protein SusC
MKTIYKKLLYLLLLLPLSIFAQSNFTGTVVDSKTKQTLPGVNVVLQGATSGTSTGFDGKFTLKGLKSGDKVIFSYIGYRSSTITFNGQTNLEVRLGEDSNELKEVVVQVGYGSVKKKDATGSVAVITAKDFNKGAIVSTDQLLAGKAAGVRITNNGGSPDSAPNIRIRGGASLSASNNPLIIIDGVPIGDLNPAGVNNPFTLINPNDVESFSILKDASATAIYGIRASNGVILITTKKGSSGAPQFNFSTAFSVGKVNRKVDVMSAQEFTSFIANKSPNLAGTLGIDDPNSNLVDNPLTKDVIEGRLLSDTNWQDVIFRTSISTDNNFSVRANLYKKIPFRLSLGFNRTEGLIKTSDYERFSYSIKLSPKLLNDNLKVDVNAKGTLTDKNNVDEGGAIGSAISMDPTKPVYGVSPNNRFVGYYQELFRNDNRDKKFGSTNPLAILEQRQRPERALRFLGNIELDYKLSFLNGLRAVANFGLDASTSKIRETFSENALNSYTFDPKPASNNPNTNYLFNPGLAFEENQTSTNTTMDLYLVYSKNLSGAIKKFDFQGGYSYQNFKADGNKQEFRNNILTGIREINFNPNNPNNRYFSPLNLQAFFGRTNIDFLGKYLFTATVRADGTSLFAKQNRWGVFPAVGLAWKLKEESFLKDKNGIKDLKLRVGWGKTGQASFADAAGTFFPTQLLFTPGNQNSQYLPNVTTYSFKDYNADLTWEKTTTINLGLDFELFKNSLLSGSFDIFTRKTNDLLAVVPFAAGSTVATQFVKNIGSTESKGYEVSLNVKAINTDKVSLNFSGNFAYNISKVTDLGGVTVTPDTGSTVSGTGVPLAYNFVGLEPSSAWAFNQVYNSAGEPIVDSYKNNDGNAGYTNADRYYKPLRPNYTYGFGTVLTVSKFDLSANFRGQIGGQIYNLKKAENGTIFNAVPQNGNSVNNILSIASGATSELFSNYNGNRQFSDYLLEDASFLRCDNISLGYKFSKFINKSSLRISFAVNNAFVITKYSGQDPENFAGIDKSLYPRPRTYTIALNLDF